MTISLILPVEYTIGSTVDLSRYGFHSGTGTVVDCRLGQSSVEAEVPDADDSPVDRIFFLAEQSFGATRDEICSGRRFERLLYPRIALTHALMAYGGMTHEDVRAILCRDRGSIYNYIHHYDNLDFMEKPRREKMLDFDRQAKLILTDY
jgi:hypothetical protein